MAINFNCTNCGKAIGVPDKMAGRKGKCPACGVQLTVPTSSTTGGAKTATRKAPGAMPKANMKTQLALDQDPRVANVLAKGKKKRAASYEDDDGVATVIDGMPEYADEGVAVPVPVDDDEFDLPEPAEDDVAEPDEVIDDDIDDDVPSAADVLSKHKTGTSRGSRAGRGADRDDSGGPKTRAQRMAEAAADKKKGGGFIWFLFGLLLAIVHTAGAMLLGAIVVLGYAEKPADFAWFEQPAKLLELDKKIDAIRMSEPAPAADPDDAGDRDDDAADPDDSGDDTN